MEEVFKDFDERTLGLTKYNTNTVSRVRGKSQSTLDNDSILPVLIASISNIGEDEMSLQKCSKKSIKQSFDYRKEKKRYCLCCVE